MRDSLDVGALSGAMAKVILVLERSRNGLSLVELSRHTGVRDLTYLRRICNDLKLMPGSRMVQRGLRGHTTWVLLDAQDGEKVTIHTRQQANDGEKVTNPIGQKTGDGEKVTIEASLKDLRLKDSDLKNLRLKDSSLQDSCAVPFSEADEAQKRLWLAQAELLFGKPVAWQPAFARKDPGEILAWLAQAHAAWRAKKINRPWGLVYRALRGELRQNRPDERFRSDPLAHLPSDYLQACGLAQPLRARPVQAPDDEEPLEDGDLPVEADLREQTPQAKAWQAVLTRLAQEMPRGPFETWLADTRALDWDAPGGLLRVAARDAEAVDWLESRVQSTAGRLLCGILNCAVHVQFVRAPDESAPTPARSPDVGPEPEFGKPLSPSMLLAVRGLAQGKQREVIARDMGISPDTLKTYLSKAYRRLGAGNAAGAVALAAQALEDR